jgi:hypothetical protein
MNYFLVEIPVPQSERADLHRAMRTLRAAQARLREKTIPVRPLLAGVTDDEAWLVFLIEAVTIEAVRSLVSLALLPAGRIREVLHLTLPGPISGASNGLGPEPGADLAPRVDTELVQNVVDMRFHGSLGDE